MSGCERVRETLPEWARGQLGAGEDRAVEAHLTGCDECRAEAELIRLLAAAPPSVPEGLAARIRLGVARDRRPSSVSGRPWWALAAAAVAAVALGIGVVSDTGSGDVTVPVYATDAAAGDAWPSVDGEIAGAPALGDLSDDELRALLDDLAAAGTGGAA